MSRIAYVDGRYIRHTEAAVHIEDRGFQFADGVYEVCAIRDGRLLDETGHLDRLERSLGELRIAMPLARAALMVVLREVVRRNRIREGMVYFQITRGVAPRDHAFPTKARPTLVVTAKHVPREKGAHNAETGVAIVSVPETRWARCDIKSVGLLPNVLAKQAAREQGAYEAWFVDSEGFVTEGSSSNAWIITRDGELVTRHADEAILNGITRRGILRVAAAQGLRIVERPFTIAEALDAKEAFISSASAYVTPVVRIDDQPVGNGAPGVVSSELRDGYLLSA